MPKFIPISTFKNLYNSQAELLTEQGAEEFLQRLEGAEGEQIKDENGISSEDFNFFIESVKNPSSILYHGWVGQNEELNSLLEKGSITRSFTDSHGFLKHQFGDGYRSFLSPYLAEPLLKFSNEANIHKLSNAVSFVVLLDSDHRAVVESQLFKSISDVLKTLKQKTKPLEAEQELIDIVKPLCSDDHISCVNSLSKASYALKLNYVDELLNVIRSKACTVRFANWILKQMEGVQLNNEHQYKIVDLRRELREGELEVRNHGEGRTPIRWKNILTTLFILIIGSGVYYIVYYKPFSEVIDPQFNNNSSFKQFSKDERKKIDSLLQEMSGNKRPEDMVYDQGVPIIGGGSTLTLRTEYKNPTMERVYDDLNKDANLKGQGIKDSCAEPIAYRRLDGIKDLKNKKGDIEVVVRNESEYDVVIFVSENMKSGETHSLLIESGETIVFEMDKFNTILAVAGNKYQAYSPPANSMDLPSDKYKYHFCETDVNYKESINTGYKLVNMKKGKTKLMIMGDKGNFFHLIDVHGVLEAI